MITKILIFDIDGTIVDKKTHKLARSTVEAIAKAKELGIKVILATGRPYCAIEKRILQAIQPDGVVALNGQLVLDSNGKVLYEQSIAPKILDQMIAFAQEHFTSYGFHLENSTVLYKDVLLEKTIDDLLGQTLGVKMSEHKDEHLTQKVFCMIYHDEDQKKKELLNSTFPTLRTDSFAKDCFDLFNGNANKKKGVEVFLSLWEMTWEETAVFGDSTNDIEMLMAARFSYLIKGGPKEMNNVNVKRIGGPLSGEISNAIYRHLPTASMNLNSDDMLHKMNGNKTKISGLMSMAFFIGSINEFLIKKDTGPALLYLGLGLVMLIAGIIAYKREFS